ncbi:MAG TPA: HEAT repeat domain-containing protein, partial [Actinoplanes sp.]
QRYWAAVALGSTGDDRAVPTLERLMAADRGVTVFDGEVRAAAKKALRTLRRIQAAIADRESAPAELTTFTHGEQQQTGKPGVRV